MDERVAFRLLVLGHLHQPAARAAAAEGGPLVHRQLVAGDVVGGERDGGVQTGAE